MFRQSNIYKNKYTERYSGETPYNNRNDSRVLLKKSEKTALLIIFGKKCVFPFKLDVTAIRRRLRVFEWVWRGWDWGLRRISSFSNSS